MIIRDEQMQAFEGQSRANFHRQLMDYLRQELPEQTKPLDDAALREQIMESERRAANYGIETQSGIAQWTCLTFALGREFDAIPQIHAFLGAQDLPDDPETRLSSLVESLNSVLGEPGAHQ